MATNNNPIFFTVTALNITIKNDKTNDKKPSKNC